MNHVQSYKSFKKRMAFRNGVRAAGLGGVVPPLLRAGIEDACNHRRFVVFGVVYQLIYSSSKTLTTQSWWKITATDPKIRQFRSCKMVKCTTGCWP